MLDLSSKVVWVTGAGGTIGSAIAIALASQGALVCLSGRTEAKLNKTADRIAGLSCARGGATVIPVDVSETRSVEDAMKLIIDYHEHVDILVNCVTLPIFGDFMTTTDDDWLRMTNTKYFGYMRTMRAVLPNMQDQGYGRIVNLTGRGGKQPTAAQIPGSACSAAIHLMSKGLSDIYAKHGIRINCIAPGHIESPRSNEMIALNEKMDAAGTGGQRTANTVSGMCRPGQADEIANAVIYLVSDLSSYVTGTVHHVDGGTTFTV